MTNYDVLLFGENGKDIVIDEMAKYDLKIRSKISRQIKYLQVFGMSRRNPSIKKLTGTHLWESRILGHDNIRILFSQYKTKIVILHVFSKKSQKTPISSIKTAQSRLDSIPYMV